MRPVLFSPAHTFSKLAFVDSSRQLSATRPDHEEGGSARPGVRWDPRAISKGIGDGRRDARRARGASRQPVDPSSRAAGPAGARRRGPRRPLDRVRHGRARGRLEWGSRGHSRHPHRALSVPRNASRLARGRCRVLHAAMGHRGWITVPLLATTAVDLTDSESRRWETSAGLIAPAHHCHRRCRRALRRSWLRGQLNWLGLPTKAAVFPDIHTL